MKNIKRYIKTVSIILVLVISALMLCSCSEEQPVIEPVMEPEVQIEEDVISEYIPEEGGEVFLVLPDDINSFDPIITEEKDLADFLSLVYERPLNITRDGHFEPGLCETWSVDETGCIYTFNIRQGVVFHDGSALNADDVMYTISRIIGNVNAPEEDSEDNTEDDVDTENNNTEDEDNNDTSAEEITGAASRYTIYNDKIVSVKKTEDYSIEITMTKPGRDALYFMTFPVLNEGSDAVNNINGTGAYKLVSKEGDKVELAINENWWRVSPYITKIVGQKVLNSNDKIAIYDEGIADIITTDSIATTKLRSQNDNQLVDYNTSYYDCIVPNLFIESMKDPNIRKAISYAINRREIIASTLLNHAVAAEIPISPSFYAYDVKYKLYEHNTDAAMDLLSDSGYSTVKKPNSNILKLSMIVEVEVGNEYKVEAARQIKQQLEEIGIECTLYELSPIEYMARLEAGNFDIAYCSYYLDQNPDISFMLKTGSEENYGCIASSELDTIIDECNASVTEEQVIENYGKMQQYFIDKVPQIGLFYRMNTLITKSNVIGIENLYEHHIYDNISSWSIDRN